MARTKAQKGAVVERKATKDKFKGFINVDFSHKLREEINTWIADRNMAFEDRVIGLAERGFKVSISYDENRDTWLCSLTGKRTYTSYDGWCVVVPHRDLDKVIYVATYVVEVMMEHNQLEIPGGDDEIDW